MKKRFNILFLLCFSLILVGCVNENPNIDPSIPEPSPVDPTPDPEVPTPQPGPVVPNPEPDPVVPTPDPEPVVPTPEPEPTPEPDKPIEVTGDINVLKSSGYLESIYLEFDEVTGAKSYEVYYKYSYETHTSYKKIDEMLIRKYHSDGKNYIRCDIVGIKEGTYDCLIIAKNPENETSIETVVSNLVVTKHDRSGFAFFNGSSSGAYNDDGTLKNNAVVVYITNNNKDSVSLNVTGATTNPCVGLQEILNGFKKGKDSRPLCVRVIGNITDLANMLKGDIVVDGCKNGITIEGIGNDATFNGFGLRIKDSINVEVRNLGFMNCDSDEGDNLGLQQNNKYIWVHNCDFFYGFAGSDSDQAKGDGALDTKTSSYITHSYNHFYDSGKCNLQGMKSETTENYITYHHNWYDHSDSRHPRVRTCTVHVYNNYYDGNSKYCIGITSGASLFSEANYFRSSGTIRPYLISLQGTDALGEGTFSGESGGVIKAYNDVYEGKTSFITHNDSQTSFDCYMATERDEVVPETYKALVGQTTYNNFDTNPNMMYTYTAQSAEDAKETVIKYSGRCEGGDFKYTFDDAADSSYDVDKVLQSLLVNYQSSLVEVFGDTLVTDTPIVDEPIEVTYNDVINLIEALPSVNDVNASHKAMIDEANSKYNSLSDENKALVTNYDKLVALIEALTSLPVNSVLTFLNGNEVDNDNFFTVSGSIRDGDGSLTLDGTTYTYGVKIDSKGLITFTVNKACTVTVYALGRSAESTLDICGQKVSLTLTTEKYEINLTEAGTYTIKKANKEAFVYMVVVSEN